MDEAHLCTVEATKCNEVQPSDSVSIASFSSLKHGSKVTSVHSSHASPSASSTRLKTELERATLIAQASSLKQKQNLEEQEAKLKREKEELEIQTALAVSDAKIKILNELEGMCISSRASSHDGMNSYVGSNKSIELPFHRQPKRPPLTDRQVAQSNDVQHNVQRSTVAATQPRAETSEDFIRCC